MRSLLSCLLAAGLTALSPARAGEPEAQLGWGLEFGGATGRVQPVYQVGLVAGGVSVFQRSYRANAAETTPMDDEHDHSTSTSWVPWVVGGVVAVVAIGAQVADDYEPKGNPCVACDDSDDLPGPEGGGMACVGNECAVCSDGSVASTCDDLIARPMRGESEVDVERQRWLDAGPGHMGDLHRSASFQ